MTISKSLGGRVQRMGWWMVMFPLSAGLLWSEAPHAQLGDDATTPSLFGAEDQSLEAKAKLISDDILPSPEEGPLQLSRDWAVYLALRHNAELNIQQLETLRVSTFEAIEEEAFASEVSAQVSFQKEVANETNRATGGQFGVEGRESAFSMGIEKEWATGTTVESSLSYERSTSDRAPEQQEARLGLRITQALLEGRDRRANLAYVSQARIDRQMSLHQLRAFTEQLVATTELAYWEYVLAKENIAIHRHGLALAQRQLRDIEQRIEVGALPQNEVAASRVELARRQQDLIDASSLLETKRLELLRWMNLGKDPYAYAIEPMANVRLEPKKLEGLAERVVFAPKSRPELLEAKSLMERRQLDVVRTQKGLLPQLDFFIDLGRTGYDDRFGSSFSQISKNETYDAVAGLTFSHRLDSSASDARYRRAQVSRKQAEQAISNLESQVILDVRLAMVELERTRQLIAATAKTLREQQVFLKAEQDRLDAGAGTSLFVAQAQRDLLERSVDEISALIAYRKALVQLYLAEGSLLQRRGVGIRD